MVMLNLYRAAIIVLPSLIVLIAIMQNALDPRLLMLDPMVAAEESGECCRTYYGLISTLGVFVWISTAAICAFAAWVLYSIKADRKDWEFALIAALFTGWLGLDDAFLVHENILPKLGVSQNLVIASYVVVGMLYGYRVLTSRLKPDLILFGTSALCLGASVGLDVALHSTDSMVVAAEDGFKFVGIWCWFGFHARLMAITVLDALKPVAAPIRPAQSRIDSLKPETSR